MNETKLNIAVIGGAGYIGSVMAKRLAKESDKYNVIIIDNISTGYKEAAKYGKLYIENCGNKNQIKEIFQKEKINAVMHFAAKALVGESVQNPLAYYKNNVCETISLLETMIECKIKYFVFSSTCATFGIPEIIPISEREKQNPCNPYGETKLIVEKILRDFDNAYGIKYSILRYFNAAGADFDGELGEAHDPETHLIPLVFDAISGKIPELTINGNNYPTKDGTCVRDYIHIEDLAEAHIKALHLIMSENKSYDFNLGSEQGYSNLEILNMIEKVTGKKINWRFGPRRPGDPPILIGDASKARKILSWQTNHNLESIISTAWKFYNSKGSNKYDKK